MIRERRGLCALKCTVGESCMLESLCEAVRRSKRGFGRFDIGKEFVVARQMPNAAILRLIDSQSSEQCKRRLKLIYQKISGLESL